MRAVAIAMLGMAACAQGGSATSTDAAGADAAIDAPPDAMPIAMTWVDDTAADFMMGTVDKASVESFGALSPAAYYTGGLLWHASDTDTFGTAATATWAMVSAFTPTAKVALARSTLLSFGTATPPSVGLTDGDAFTMWWEGEVFLDAGTYTFDLLADDHGFVELATSPTAAYTRVVSADFPTAASGTFAAPAAGWYPIRYAISEATGNALVQLQIQGPGIAPFQAIPRSRLRAKVNNTPGLFEAGFDDGHLVGDTASTIDQVTPTNTNWNTGNPGDLAMTAADDFSVRWSGQFRIDVAGMYAFHYVTDDGQRLWIDGTRVLDAWDDTTHDQTSAAIMLDAGWHDLVVDHTERAGGAIAALTVASGPELAGQPLPLDRLRPVEARGERYETGVDHTDRAIPDLGQAPDSTVALTAPAGAVVNGLDVSYSFTHTFWNDLEIRLIAPNGTTVLIRDNVGGGTSGVETQRLYRTDFNGVPVAGTWLLRVNDTVSADTGTLLDFQLTPHYTGGESPIAPTAAYESRIRDLGSVAQIAKVSWTERLPTGADIAVRVRTGDTMEACATAQWSAPITDPTGGKPAIMPRRFVQYRVEMTSNGDRAPILDKLTLEYSVNP